jgi:hypothetical protein
MSLSLRVGSFNLEPLRVGSFNLEPLRAGQLLNVNRVARTNTI